MGVTRLIGVATIAGFALVSYGCPHPVPTEDRHIHHYRYPPGALVLGETLRLEAAVCTYGRCGDDSTLTLETSDSTVIALLPNGWAVGRSTGKAVLTLTADRVLDVAIPISVTNAVVRVVVYPHRVVMTVGDTAWFDISAYDARGEPIEDQHFDFDYSGGTFWHPMFERRARLVAFRPGDYLLIGYVGGVKDTATVRVEQDDPR